MSYSLCCWSAWSSSSALILVTPAAGSGISSIATVGRHSFPVAASILWNSLSPDSQSSSSLTDFCHTFCCTYPYIDFAFVDFVMTPVILAKLKIPIWFQRAAVNCRNCQKFWLNYSVSHFNHFYTVVNLILVFFGRDFQMRSCWNDLPRTKATGACERQRPVFMNRTSGCRRVTSRRRRTLPQTNRRRTWLRKELSTRTRSPVSRIPQRCCHHSVPMTRYSPMADDSRPMICRRTTSSRPLLLTWRKMAFCFLTTEMMSVEWLYRWVWNWNLSTPVPRKPMRRSLAILRRLRRTEASQSHRPRSIKTASWSMLLTAPRATRTKPVTFLRVVFMLAGQFARKRTFSV